MHDYLGDDDHKEYKEAVENWRHILDKRKKKKKRKLFNKMSNPKKVKRNSNSLGEEQSLIDRFIFGEKRIGSVDEERE